MDRTDGELINAYCRGSQAALTELIRRHVDLVYAVAIQRTGDPSLADDVTQAVFIVLVKKVRSLRSCATIAGWLILVTRNVARAATRAQMRRRFHERAAAKRELRPMENHSIEKSELAFGLDDALARLGATDRDAVVLRYLQSCSLADVGSRLGISEEAARKRVARGVSRLRELFSRRGIPSGTLGLSVAISALAALRAPAATVQAAIAPPQLSPSHSVVSLSKGMIRMLAIKKLTTVSAMILLGLASIAGVTALAQSNSFPRAPAAPAPASADAMAPDLQITAVALQMPVTDVNANVAFFEKIGFRLRSAAKPDAANILSWASMQSGPVRIRLVRVAVPVHPDNNLIAYFWIDGGRATLTTLHDDIGSRGIPVGNITRSGETLLQLDITTPDGYTVGFFSQGR
jgi:RNA polymerase sigma factor (sigma-70 family)